MQRAYEIMKEGSKTIYQPETTQHSSCRVVLIDIFEIRWGIMTKQAGLRTPVCLECYCHIHKKFSTTSHAYKIPYNAALSVKSMSYLVPCEKRTPSVS